ncbi:MAG: DUF6916 family protein [Pyrinomonadaceae bacterium]
MAMSRRFFLKSGTLTAIAAGVALRPNLLAFGQKGAQATSLGYQIPIKAQQRPSYMFTRATFDPYVGGIFQAPDARGRMVSLRLLSATSSKPSAGTKISTAKAVETDSFSLMFKAARLLPDSKSTHTISHPSLGKFDLFLTPHSQADGVMLYEAVFNHI